MGAPASAYAALGLEPGADRTAVEQAYRRLIKLHHPDRSGGDASRAAEINRAYFELRRQPEPDPPPPAAGRRSARSRNSARKRRRRRSRQLWLALILSAGALLIIERERFAGYTTRWIAALFAVPETGRGNAAKIDDAELDGPLADAAIESSIDQARRLVRSGDQEAMAQHSRDCHRRMRADPELAQLDRCAAFDDAIAAFGDSAATGDRGRFGAAALTARQMTAASLLSSDYLAIERRLDRVRTTVQMALIPRLPPLPPPAPVNENPADAVLPPDEPGAGSN